MSRNRICVYRGRESLESAEIKAFRRTDEQGGRKANRHMGCNGGEGARLGYAVRPRTRSRPGGSQGGSRMSSGQVPAHSDPATCNRHADGHLARWGWGGGRGADSTTKVRMGVVTVGGTAAGPRLPGGSPSDSQSGEDVCGQVASRRSQQGASARDGETVTEKEPRAGCFFRQVMRRSARYGRAHLTCAAAPLGWSAQVKRGKGIIGALRDPAITSPRSHLRKVVADHVRA